MAEQDNAQEKTEPATPRHLEKAREEGQIPRSKELNTSAVLLAGTSSLLLFGEYMAEAMMRVAKDNFQLERAVIYDDFAMGNHLGSATMSALNGMVPFFLVLLIAATLGPVVLGGFLFSSKSIAPKLSRINPLEGLKRMFSMRSVVELLKAVAKILVVGSVALIILMSMRWDLISLGSEAMQAAAVHSLRIIGFAALGMSAATLLIVLVDVPFQLFDHAKKLRMTRQQVKDELKDTEGKPEVKGRIRQLQRELARSRMMGKVPQADVVITNPTHYAVALRYDLEKSSAPLLLAKGSDLIALHIRDIAKANSIPIVVSPALARAIYYSTELENEIPHGLYVAVAQVLAYVFHLRSYRRGLIDKPHLPDDLPIPEEYQR